MERYTIEEIQEHIAFMKSIFDVVRIVDPAKTAIATITKEGDVELEEYACFRVWGKDTRCENCVSMCAVATECQMTKYEFIENNIFYVITRPLEIVKRNQESFRCVLEVVSHVSDHLLMEPAENMTVRQMLEEVQMKIYTDELTGLYNRRYLDEMLFAHKGLVEVAKQVGFIMIDMNNFKDVNDLYGHATGDEVLMEVSKLLKKEMEEHDSAIRYGGDEFLLVLTNYSEDKVLKTMKQIQKKMENTRFVKDQGITLSASYGCEYIDSFRLDQTLMNQAIQAADVKMYEMKRQYHSLHDR